MSLPTKTDFVGLATTGLELRGNDTSTSANYLEKLGANGAITASEIFGEVSAPSCEYAITSTLTNFTKNLGQVYGSQTDKYALQSITISTSAGGEPTMTATAVQIESGASRTVCVFATPQVTLTPAYHAITFGAFTYDEDETLALQGSTFTALVDIKPTTVNGVPKASDATGGKATVAATFWSTSDVTAPEIEVASGWEISSPMTSSGQDGDFFTWTCTLTKHLTALVETAS